MGTLSPLVLERIPDNKTEFLHSHLSRFGVLICKKTERDELCLAGTLDSLCKAAEILDTIQNVTGKQSKDVKSDGCEVCYLCKKPLDTQIPVSVDKVILHVPLCPETTEKSTIVLPVKDELCLIPVRERSTTNTPSTPESTSDQLDLSSKTNLVPTLKPDESKSVTQVIETALNGENEPDESDEIKEETIEDKINDDIKVLTNDIPKTKYGRAIKTPARLKENILMEEKDDEDFDVEDVDDDDESDEENDRRNCKRKSGRKNTHEKLELKFKHQRDKLLKNEETDEYIEGESRTTLKSDGRIKRQSCRMPKNEDNEENIIVRILGPKGDKKILKKYYEEKMPYKFFCNLCSFKAKRQNHYERHLTVHTPDCKILECEHCDFKTVRSSVLYKHKLSHSNSLIKCTVDGCNYKTDSQDNLNKHQKIKHDVLDNVNAFQLQCQYCSFSSMSKLQLSKHVLKKHSSTKKAEDGMFQCDQCGFKSKKKVNLVRHQDNVHKDRRPHLCEKCGRSFKRFVCWS